MVLGGHNCFFWGGQYIQLVFCVWTPTQCTGPPCVDIPWVSYVFWICQPNIWWCPHVWILHCFMFQRQFWLPMFWWLRDLFYYSSWSTLVNPKGLQPWADEASFRMSCCCLTSPMRGNWFVKLGEAMPKSPLGSQPLRKRREPVRMAYHQVAIADDMVHRKNKQN